MMDEKNWFLGDIKKCTKMCVHDVGLNGGGYLEYDEEVVSFSSPLFRTSAGKYINLANLYLLEMLAHKVVPKSNWLKMTNVLMTTSPMQEGDFFVDERTLQPYQNNVINYYENPDKTFKKAISQ